MGLVTAKCPSCGAAIQIPEGTDRCLCTFCGAQVLTEAAINFARVEVSGTVQARMADFDVQAGVLKGYHGASTDVVIPEGVKTIDSRAFAGMPITSVTLPASIESVRFDDFSKIPTLKEMHYATDGNDWFDIEGILCSSTNSAILFYPPAKADEYTNVGGTTKKVRIVNNPYLLVLNISTEPDVFPVIEVADCPNLHTINLPASGITSIAVSGCGSLERLDLPNFVTEVNLKSCPKLTMVTTQSALDKLVVDGCYNASFNTEGAYDLPAGTKSASIDAPRATRLIVREGIEELRVDGPALKYVEIAEGVKHFKKLRFGPLHEATVKLPASLIVVDQDSFRELYGCTIDWPSIDTATIHDLPLTWCRSAQWSDQGRCPYCGGKLRGLFKSKHCASCGKEVPAS